MIDLTRLNGHRLVVNCDLIKLVESTPDTTITLINGEKLIVLEPLEELLVRVAVWRSRILQLAWPDAATALAATASCTPNHFPPVNEQ
jgi:flagellar protein FlbD